MVENWTPIEILFRIYLDLNSLIFILNNSKKYFVSNDTTLSVSKLNK